MNQNTEFQKERGVQRLPSWMLVLLTAGLVAAALLFLLVPGLQSREEPAGYLSPIVTVDGQEVEADEPLLYREGGALYLHAENLAKLLSHVQLDQIEYDQTSALLISCVEIGCSAALLEDGTLWLLDESEEPMLTPMPRPPILSGETYLVPMEGVSLSFCCLIQWNAQTNTLSLSTPQRAVEETVALVESHGLTVKEPETASQKRLLYSGVFPVQNGAMSTLFSRASGALFEALEGTFARCHYGYLYRGDNAQLGLYSVEGVQLLPAQYRAIDFFEVKAGLVVTTDGAQMQRLWMVSDGGILPLTDQDCLAVGHGYSVGDQDEQPRLLEEDLIAIRRADGLWGVLDWETGRMCVPFAFDAIGGYMDVGDFVYATQGDEAALSGVQPTLTLWYDVAETPALVVQKEGLWGVVDLLGETLVDFSYEAVFSAPFGDSPGWYGLRDGAYELLAPIDAGQRPVLDTAAQLALSGAGLVLLEKEERGVLVADTATGTAYLLPDNTGERLFGEMPLFSVVHVVERNGVLDVSGVPTPPYALFPVVPAGDNPEQAALAYPALLLSNMSYSGGRLGLTRYTLSDVSIAETGDAYYTLTFAAQIEPQREAGKAAGTLWGEPGENGMCDLSLELTVYLATTESGQAYLCAVGQDEVSPFAQLPEAALWEPLSYRYTTTPLEKRYTQMMAGAVEEHVFFEDEQATYIEERRLERAEGSVGYRYRITVARLEEEQRHTLFDMPDALGDLNVLEVTQQGMLVTTWCYAYASSGWEGSLGILNDAGFSPLLARAVLIGRRENRCYFVGERGEVRGIYGMDLKSNQLRLLCTLPGEPFSTVRRNLILQSIGQHALTLAWPSPAGDHCYEVYSISLPRGEITQLWPQP